MRELKRPGVNLVVLWEEYRAIHPQGYAYSRFCQLFREFERRLSPTMSSTALVRYRGNDYSVPTRHGFADVLVKGFVEEVVILCGGKEIARHPRSYAVGAFVADPLHYLALIEMKPNALDQAPYSPGLNPIENAFSQLKAFLRQAAARTIDELWDVIRRGLDTFTPKDCANYFTAAVYSLD